MGQRGDEPSTDGLRRSTQKLGSTGPHRRTHASRWSVVLIVVVLLATTACKPVPEPPTRPTPRPVSNTIDWIGDSNTGLLRSYAGDYWRNGVPPGADFFSVDKSGAQIGDHNQAEIERFRAGRPRILVIAEGTNNALKDQWDQADELHLLELFEAAHPHTCIVMVLGGYTDNLPLPKRQQFDIARQQISVLASQRPRTVVVDWMPMAQEHPEYLYQDGIHLTTTEGLNGFADVAWDGVRECRRDGRTIKPSPKPAKAASASTFVAGPR